MAAFNMMVSNKMKKFYAHIESAVIKSALERSHVPKINSLGLALRIITLLLSDSIGSWCNISSG